MDLLVAALLAAAAAAGFGLARWWQGRRLRLLEGARSTSIEELQDLQASVAGEMGGGSYRELVKLEGELVCDEPLQAPWSGEACVAFLDTVNHVFQQQVQTTSTDADGRTTRSSHWEQRQESVSRLERRCPFGLRQGERVLAVDPTGADLELETVIDSLEPGDPAAGSGLGRGGAQVRSLGLRRQESLLRAAGRIFLLAEASDATGVLSLARPEHQGLFLIRREGEAALLGRTRRWRRLWSVASALMGMLAIGLAVTALL